MREANERCFLAKAVEYPAPRLPCLRGVVIRPHAELGIFSLDRRMDHVAGDQGVGAGTADQNRVVVDGVAGGGNELHRLAERKIALDDLLAPGGDNRQYRVGDPGNARRVFLLLLRPECELAVGHDVFSLRESRYPATVLEPRVPAHMVDVQMRAHHVVDVVYRDAGGREAFLEAVALEHVPERPRRTRLVVADARIDQDGVLRRPYDKALYAQHQPAAGRIDEGRLQPGEILLKQLPGERREEFHYVEERPLLLDHRNDGNVLERDCCRHGGYLREEVAGPQINAFSQKRPAHLIGDEGRPVLRRWSSVWCGIRRDCLFRGADPFTKAGPIKVPANRETLCNFIGLWARRSSLASCLSRP